MTETHNALSFKSWLIATLLGAITLFIYFLVSWTILPSNTMAFNQLFNNSEVVQVLGFDFGLYLLSAGLMAWLLAQLSGSSQSELFWKRIKFCIPLSVLVVLTAYGPNSIWVYFLTEYTLVNIVDNLFSIMLSGVVIAKGLSKFRC